MTVCSAPVMCVLGAEGGGEVLKDGWVAGDCDEGLQVREGHGLHGSAEGGGWERERGAKKEDEDAEAHTHSLQDATV